MERIGPKPLVNHEGHPGARSVSVASVTLAEVVEPYMARPIRLVKVDIEGGEYELVRQLTPQLARAMPLLSFEVHDLGPRAQAETIRAWCGYRRVILSTDCSRKVRGR